MKKAKTHFICQECGAVSPKWMGRCPSCANWGTMVEERASHPAASNAGQHDAAQPLLLEEVSLEDTTRYSTGSEEFDRVLGGGVIPGELLLVGGDPGIGKSTLLLQTAHRVSRAGASVLYVTGEESPQQVRLRADRLGAGGGNLYVLAETDWTQIEKNVERLNPIFLIIDSVQTMFHPALPSAPGTVQQVREVALQALRLAKDRQTAICLVGHVTRDGTIAGPRLMEHMVDAVLYFEGDRHHRFRILRTVKNRFGSTNEIGVFDMRADGLEDVHSPSEFFLAERSEGAAGSVIVASLEGTRPVLAEVQALVAASAFGTPRRTASGLDYNRVNLLMAVLEKRTGLYLQGHDAYVNVAGGMRLEEPAIDLGLALAVASSFRDRPLPARTVVVGEVGLTGEVRAVSRLEQRIQEAEKLGFEQIVAPGGNVSRMKDFLSGQSIRVLGVGSLDEALRTVLGG